jgi:maltose O-acetyltransferase
LKELQFVGRGVEVYSPDQFVAGRGLILGTDVVISNADSLGIFIGDNVAIARRSYLRTANHSYSPPGHGISWSESGHSAESVSFGGGTYSIVIESDCWIASHCILLSGAHIGRGSIVSAGSVVSRSIPPNSLVVGNPGRVVGDLIKMNSAKSELLNE